MQSFLAGMFRAAAEPPEHLITDRGKLTHLERPGRAQPPLRSVVPPRRDGIEFEERGALRVVPRRGQWRGSRRQSEALQDRSCWVGKKVRGENPHGAADSAGTREHSPRGPGAATRPRDEPGDAARPTRIPSRAWGRSASRPPALRRPRPPALTPPAAPARPALPIALPGPAPPCAAPGETAGAAPGRPAWPPTPLTSTGNAAAVELSLGPRSAVTYLHLRGAMKSGGWSSGEVHWRSR